MTEKTTRRLATVLAGCLILFGGCKSSEPPKTDKSSMQEFFPAYADHQIHAFQDVQIANGARADSTMLDYYFDEAELNILGRNYLDMIVDPTSEKMTTIYMYFPESEMMDQRRDAVLAYLGGKGVAESNLKFVSGPNPARLAPAAGGLARLPRTESSGAGAYEPDPGTFTGNNNGNSTSGGVSSGMGGN